MKQAVIATRLTGYLQLAADTVTDPPCDQGARSERPDDQAPQVLHPVILEHVDRVIVVEDGDGLEAQVQW